MTTTINAGGGDYQGLPTSAVKYRRTRKGSSIDWDRITADYIAAGGQVDASVWPNNGKVVVTGGSNARSSRVNVHTFTEASEYDEPAAPKRAQVGKLSPIQRQAIGNRYRDGESLNQLAKAYSVTVTTITKTLAALEIPTRNRAQAGKVTRERNAS